MTRATSAPRFAALSYHSWEIDLRQLEGDIATLRREGWTFVSAGEALSMLRGDAAPADRCCLITSDDGHVDDEPFFARLDQLDCPGVTFVNLGRLPADRLPFYQQLDSRSVHAVEDHGRLHRRHFISGKLIGFLGPASRTSGLDHLHLPFGAPLCEAASEVAFPRFDPAEDVLATIAELDTTSADGELRARRLLLDRGLAYERNGEFHLHGTTESKAAHLHRVRSYLEDGRRLFASTLGRAPHWYAYTWWQGSRDVDHLLHELGYQGSFAGTGGDVPCEGRTFGIPRVRADTRLPRPLPLDGVRSDSASPTLRERIARRLRGLRQGG